jgi:hypothetical protein
MLAGLLEVPGNGLGQARLPKLPMAFGASRRPCVCGKETGGRVARSGMWRSPPFPGSGRFAAFARCGAVVTLSHAEGAVIFREADTSRLLIS